MVLDVPALPRLRYRAEVQCRGPGKNQSINAVSKFSLIKVEELHKCFFDGKVLVFE